MEHVRNSRQFPECPLKIQVTKPSLIYKTVIPALGSLRPENNLGNLKKEEEEEGKMEKDNGKGSVESKGRERRNNKEERRTIEVSSGACAGS